MGDAALLQADQHRRETPAPNALLPMLEASSGATTQVELVDVEQLYSPDLPETERSMAGSPGYAHATAASGIWEQAGDRFAGAILLAEMLTWSSPRIRDEAAGDSFFEPSELQRDCQRYRVLRATLVEEARRAGRHLAGPGLAEPIPA